MCGARDTVGFRAAMETGVKPKGASLTYEGTYSEHTFYTGSEMEEVISCECHSFISKDPLSQQDEYYLGIFQNSKFDGTGIVNRPPLNLVICLDISGSMASSFRSGSSESKISVAKKSLMTLVKQLKPNDSLSIVTFNNEADTLLPFVKRANMDLDKVSSNFCDLVKLKRLLMEIDFCNSGGNFC